MSVYAVPRESICLRTQHIPHDKKLATPLQPLRNAGGLCFCSMHLHPADVALQTFAYGERGRLPQFQRWNAPEHMIFCPLVGPRFIGSNIFIGISPGDGEESEQTKMEPERLQTLRSSGSATVPVMCSFEVPGSLCQHFAQVVSLSLRFVHVVRT